MRIRKVFTKRPGNRRHRSAGSPVIEPLEDRLVPTAPYSRLILIANSDLGESGSGGYQGIVGVDPTSGDQYKMVAIPTTNNGNEVYPADVTEAPSETLYVADLGDLSGTDGNGAGIISIPYSSGGGFSPPSWITTAHPYDGLVYINGYIYAIDYGDGKGSAHSLYKIDPSGGSTTLISSGGTGNSGGQGFFVPTAIYPVPGDSNDVYIVDEQQRDSGLSDAHGTVWEVNLTSGTQTIVTRGTPYLDVTSGGGTHYGNPVEVAVYSSTMYILQDGPIQ